MTLAPNSARAARRIGVCSAALSASFPATALALPSPFVFLSMTDVAAQLALVALVVLPLFGTEFRGVLLKRLP